MAAIDKLINELKIIKNLKVSCNHGRVYTIMSKLFSHTFLHIDGIHLDQYGAIGYHSMMQLRHMSTLCQFGHVVRGNGNQKERSQHTEPNGVVNLVVKYQIGLFQFGTLRYSHHLVHEDVATKVDHFQSLLVACHFA